MILKQWIENAFLDTGTKNKSVIKNMYNEACNEFGQKLNIETYNRTIRKVYNELFKSPISTANIQKIENMFDMGNVLVVGDLHSPFEHKKYLSFCKAKYKEFDCDTVVFIGDIVDNHAISYHESDPDGLGAADELEAASKSLQKWYKVFPNAYVCMGNHDLLIERKARTHGLPKRLFKSFKEIIGAPKGWTFGYSFQIDGVKYMHGTGGGGKNAHSLRAMKNRQSTVIGHFHSTLGIEYMASHKDLIFGMNVGCTDYDTEFLSKEGWKPIGDYNDELVGQYNQDGTVNFVKPINYIKLPETYLNHIENNYGLNMTFCDNHDVLYLNTNNTLCKDSGKNIINRHNTSKNGFNGRIISRFIISNEDRLNYSDDEIRLLLAIQADGTIKDKLTKNVHMSFKKDRKIKRLILLLDNLNIKYDKYIYDDITKFIFEFSLATKVFGKEWYSATYGQLKTITNEVLHWDGNIDDNIYYSTIKENADFIQYAFTATDNRTHINIDDRADTSTCYRVCISKTKKTRTLAVHSNKSEKSQFVKVPTIDGYKYCFTVPSGMLILRTNNCIYATGNCGIDINSYAMEYGKDFVDRPVLGCGIVFGGKSATTVPMRLK